MEDTCLDVPMDSSSGRQPINITITADYANAINQLLPVVSGNGSSALDFLPAILALLELYVIPEDSYIPDGVLFYAPLPGNGNSSLTIDVTQRARAKLISNLLAGVVTDGLARVAGNGAWPFSPAMFLLPNSTADGVLQGLFPQSSAEGGEVNPLNVTDLEASTTWLLLNPTFQRYGYGYGWQKSRTTQFGISVLLIHIFVAITHTIYVIVDVVGRGKGTQSAWESIPELFALAVNSTSSERLRNTCAGISKTKTWCETIGVREMSEGHLEVVVGKQEMQEAAPPRVGVAYGALPELSPSADAQGHLKIV